MDYLKWLAKYTRLGSLYFQFNRNMTPFARSFLSSIAGCVGIVAFLGMLRSWDSMDQAPHVYVAPPPVPQSATPAPESPPKPALGNLYVIDAGHGGHDPGTQGFGIIEKNLTLKLSIELAAQLKKAGLRVLPTRHDDSFVSLPDRCSISNLSEAHAFISLHMNADANSSSTTGVEVFYTFRKRGDHIAALKSNLGIKDQLGVRDERGYKLAELLQGHLSKDLKLRDRGTKEGNLFVIAQTASPAVLVECGYLSNPEEAKFLSQDKVIEQLAKSITKGILEYDQLTKNDPHFGIALVSSEQQPVPIPPVLNRP